MAGHMLEHTVLDNKPGAGRLHMHSACGLLDIESAQTGKRSAFSTTMRVVNNETRS